MFYGDGVRSHGELEYTAGAAADRDGESQEVCVHGYRATMVVCIDTSSYINTKI